jgi:VWFA-related protein
VITIASVPFDRPHRPGWWMATLVPALVLSTGVAAGAKEPPAPPAVSAEIAVTVVEIPVEVLRGSEAVRGLTAADFEVVEKGQSLPIVGFETVDLGSPRPEKRKAPASQAARRHLFLLFDFAFSRPERLADGIAAARTLVAGSLDPEDLVAVGVYLPKGELPLLLNFTADRAAADRTLATLAAAVARKEPPDVAAKPDPLRLTGVGVPALLAQTSRVEERNFARDTYNNLDFSDRTWGGFLMRNILNHSAYLDQSSVDAHASSHVKAMTDAMEGLAGILRPVTGRKYLALFSEGFSMSLATRTSGGIGDSAIGGSDLLKTLDQTVGELRRSGWILHSVNLAGTRNGLNADGLFYLAKETGGVLVEGTNKLAEGMDQALRRSAHGYVLTVQVDVASDGAYHPLDVRLRQPAAHTQLHHRGGYFAPLPFRRQNEVQRLSEAARLVAGDEERNELGVRAVAVPLGAGAETTPVAVVVEVPGAPLLAAGTPRLGIDVFGYALSETGANSDFFAQAVALDRAKVGTRLAQGGVRVLAKLNLPPGRQRVRVLVRDRANGRLSLLSLPLSLPAAAAEPGPGLNALFLSSVQDPWLLVRSTDASFALHDRTVLPAAHAVLPPAGEAQLLLLGHGFKNKGAWIRGRILTAEGKTMDGGALDLLTVTAGASAGEPDLVVARLRTGTLPPGDYLLDLRLGKEATVQATTVRPFTVASSKT